MLTWFPLPVLLAEELGTDPGAPLRERYRQVLTADPSCLAQGWHEQAWQLAMALNTFHRRGGHFQGWIETWTIGLTAAGQLGQRAARPTALGFLGFAGAHAGRHAEAVDHLSRALSLAERTGDKHRQAHVHMFLCATWSMREAHRQALSHATSALSLFQALGDLVWEADALNSAGTCQAGVGQLSEARTLDGLGYIAHQAGHYPRALDYYAQVLVLHRDLGSTYRQPLRWPDSPPPTPPRG